MPAQPYVPPSISGFNSAPPSDDGSQVASNLVTWAGILAKLALPLNVFAAAINVAVQSAFASLVMTTDPGEENVILASREFLN